MDFRAARRILDAALPSWADAPPEWQDVLPHESVRRFHALLVHAIEQHGWEDPVDAAIDLLESESPRAEERLLTEALATWAESTAAPAVPEPPEAPGALREWARQTGVEDLLDLSAADLSPSLAPSFGRATVADLYRAVSAPTRGRESRWPEDRAAATAEDLRRILHEEATRRAEQGGAWDRLRELEKRDLGGHVGELFARLTELARELEPQAGLRLPPTPMTFRDDPPRFVRVEDARGVQNLPEAAVLLEDGRTPIATSPLDDRPATLLALVNGARLALGEPDEARRVEEVLSTPGWQRMLASVDEALAEVDVDGAADLAPEERLEWRIEAAPGGDVTVWPYVQRARKHGGWTRGRRAGEYLLSTLRLPARSRSERIALTLLARARPASPRQVADVLELLSDHPLVHATTGAPVAVRRTTPRLAFEEADGGLVPRVQIGGVRLVPRDAHARLRRNDVLLVLEEGESPVVWVASFDEAQRAVVRALATRGVQLPDEPEARRALASHLPALAARFDLDLPEALRGRPVPGDHRPLIRLDLRERALHVWLGVRPLPGIGLLRAGEGPPVAVAFVEGAPVHVRRDLERERATEDEEIARLGLAPHRQPDGSYVIADLDVALDVVEAVQGRGDALQVEWARDERPRVGTLRASQLELRVGRSRDWFRLAGGAETDVGHVDLARLLRAVREGRRFVEVAPGAFARIEASLRRRLVAAEAHIREDHGEQVFGNPAAEVIADLAGDATLDAAPSFFDLLERIRRAREEEPRLESPIAAALRPYQLHGFEWLARLGAWGVGGVLADDMGLGKTLQALALLSYRASEGPALVVAPTSVVGNWAREAERFSPDLRFRVHRGPAHERRVGEPGPGDVLVTSYDIAIRDAEDLQALRFATVVLDEAQLVKNPATRRARVMRDLDADLKVALTGTPIENHLGELWSILRIVCPQLLGSWDSFRTRFAIPIERDGNPLRQKQLADVLRPFILRRTKAEVAPELPPRTEMVREIDLTPEERALYDRVRAQALAATLERSDDGRFALLAALTRLRQLACDPRLIEPAWTGPTTKLDELVRLLVELKEEGHRALVFSQFKRLLFLARDALAAQGIVCLELNGDTPAADRERRVQRFQDGAADAFLISLKAGGTGLNLTAATYVIHLDPWWNPAAEDQATDRAHRIGQPDPVTVYRLVSTGTIEEAVLSLHGDKRALADGILAGKDAAATLDTEALAELLRYG